MTMRWYISALQAISFTDCFTYLRGGSQIHMKNFFHLTPEIQISNCRTCKLNQRKLNALVNMKHSRL